jgi:hypothetical protein
LQRGPSQQRGQQLRGPGRQNQQLRATDPRQRATTPQLQRGRSAVPPNKSQTRRRPYEDNGRPVAGPRGTYVAPFRSPPPLRQFNQQRLR